MEAPLIERRRNPILPPVQALALYVFVVIIVAVVTYGISERNARELERAKLKADYERCLAGTEILQIGNEQVRALRAVVSTIIEGQEISASAAETVAERRRFEQRAGEYRAMVDDINEYPVYQCERDGSRKESPA